MTMNTKTTLLLAALAVALPLQAEAAEARTPVYQPGTTISQPGHYVLTRDIAATGATIVTITADGVTLDLNGHMLSDTTLSQSLIYITGTAGAADGVTIRNGRLSGGVVAINTAAGARRRLELTQLEISGPGSDALFLRYIDHVEITHCRIVGAGERGIRIVGVDGSYSARIEHNVIEDSGSRGILLTDMRGGILRGNVIAGSGVDGSGRPGLQLESGSFTSGGNLIVDNTVRGSLFDNPGIHIQAGNDSNLVLRNIVTGNGGHGMLIESDGNRVAGNTVNDNTWSGIYLGGADFNLIERNTLAGNEDYGLVCSGSSDGTAWRDNMIRGNTDGSVGNTCATSGPWGSGNIE